MLNILLTMQHWNSLEVALSYRRILFARPPWQKLLLEAWANHQVGAARESGRITEMVPMPMTVTMLVYTKREQ